MNWIKFNRSEQFGENLKVETIYRIEYETNIGHDNDGKMIFENKVEYGIVGDINKSKGTNDEFTEDNITYYTEDLIPTLNQLLEEAKNDFYKNKL